jgi:hypothetical protein
MRPPFVKRQTTPESGFFLFFRFLGSGVVGSWARGLARLPCAGANHTWLHQTLIEAQSPLAWRLQRAVDGLLCGLEIMLCPHTVLFKGLAERVRLASECQARGRGSTRRPCATIAACSKARAGVQSKPRALGHGAYTRLRVQRRSHSRQVACSRQADPVGVQLDARLTRSAPLSHRGICPDQTRFLV